MQDEPAMSFDPIGEARRQWIEHGWQDAADGMAVVTSVVRVDQILQAQIDSILKALNLTFARYELLVLLDFSKAGALPLGKIGERLQVHPASVTNAVDKLELDGLVERRPHPDDGRATLATLTSQGRRLARKATKMLNGQVFSNIDLSGEEQQRLFELLHKVRHAAGDFT